MSRKKWWWGGVGGESAPSSPPLPLSPSPPVLLIFFPLSDIMLEGRLALKSIGTIYIFIIIIILLLLSCWLPLSERLQQARKLRTLRITQYSILLPVNMFLRMIESSVILHLTAYLTVTFWQITWDYYVQCWVCFMCKLKIP